MGMHKKWAFQCEINILSCFFLKKMLWNLGPMNKIHHIDCSGRHYGIYNSQKKLRISYGRLVGIAYLQSLIYFIAK